MSLLLTEAASAAVTAFEAWQEAIPEPRPTTEQAYALWHGLPLDGPSPHPAFRTLARAMLALQAQLAQDRALAAAAANPFGDPDAPHPWDTADDADPAPV